MILQGIARLIGRLGRSERGGVLIEAAFTIPIALMLLMGGFEIARLTLIHQKMDRAATAMADLVSASEDISESQLADMFNAMQHIMEPFDISGSGVVVVSSIGKPVSGSTTIYWQRNGAGSISVTSQIGTEGNAPTLPAGFVVRDGEGLIVAEVYYDYQPLLFWDFVGANQLYHRAFFRPRYGGLDVINP
jgi:Flp pilus assembly protein TadG